jgi:hypothetical protein
MTAIFGKPWNAPVCESATVLETPVGDECFRCAVPIEDGDQGYVIPRLTVNDDYRFDSWHRECFLRSIFGCHEHVRGDDDCKGADCLTGTFPRTPGERRVDALEHWARMEKRR